MGIWSVSNNPLLLLTMAVTGNDAWREEENSRFNYFGALWHLSISLMYQNQTLTMKYWLSRKTRQ